MTAPERQVRVMVLDAQTDRESLQLFSGETPSLSWNIPLYCQLRIGKEKVNHHVLSMAKVHDQPVLEVTLCESRRRDRPAKGRIVGGQQIPLDCDQIRNDIVHTFQFSASSRYLASSLQPHVSPDGTSAASASPAGALSASSGGTTAPGRLDITWTIHLRVALVRAEHVKGDMFHERRAALLRTTQRLSRRMLLASDTSAPVWDDDASFVGGGGSADVSSGAMMGIESSGDVSVMRDKETEDDDTEVGYVEVEGDDVDDDAEDSSWVSMIGDGEVSQYSMLSGYQNTVAYSTDYGEMGSSGESAADETSRVGDDDDVKTISPGASLIGDFNERYQRALSALTLQRSTDTLGAVLDCAQDFLFCARTYGRIIVSERFLDVRQKAIRPVSIGGVAGGEKFIIRGILFKFCIDLRGLFGNDDGKAAKVAGHDLKGLVHYSNLGIDGLSFPMMALVDHRGYRLLCMSLLPISQRTLIYGSADAGQTVRAVDVRFNALMAKAARGLNLRDHLCGPMGVRVHSAVDMEGHRGQDGRYYLLDFSRAFPPERVTKHAPRCSHLYRLLRPELVAKWPDSLCSDAYTKFVSARDPHSSTYKRDVRMATSHMVKIIIPQLVAKLARRIEEEDICPNGVGNFCLTAAVHRAGVNMAAAVALDHPYALNLRNLILLEMVSRVVKNDYRSRLRNKMAEIKQPAEQPYFVEVAKWMNLVFGASADSDRYWDDHIVKGMQTMFHYRQATHPKSEQPPNLRAKLLHRAYISNNFRNALPLASILFERIKDMTGLSLTKPVKRDARSGVLWHAVRPFTAFSFKQLGERVKDTNLVLQTRSSYLNRMALSLMRTNPEAAIDHFTEANGLLVRLLRNNPMDTKAFVMAASTAMWIVALESKRDVEGGPSTAAVRRHPLLWKTFASIEEHRDEQRLVGRDAERFYRTYATFLCHCGDVWVAELHFLAAWEADPQGARLEHYMKFLRDTGRTSDAAAIASVLSSLKEDASRESARE